MKKKISLKILLAGLAFVVLAGVTVFSMGGPVSGQDEKVSAWTVRCEEEGDNAGHCEMFQRLVVTETGQRVTEMAIGFPKDQEGARGVVILPLGTMLTEDVTMTIDEGKSFSFKVRYCVQQGCFAFVGLNDKLLDMLGKGKEATISLFDMNGQQFNVKLSLEGFSKTLKEIS